MVVEEEEEEITDIPKGVIEIIRHEVAEDFTAVPSWTYMLLFLYIFLMPYFAWLFGWSWWPGIGIHVILIVISAAVLVYWGRRRRARKRQSQISRE